MQYLKESKKKFIHVVSTWRWADLCAAHPPPVDDPADPPPRGYGSDIAAMYGFGWL